MSEIVITANTSQAEQAIDSMTEDAEIAREAIINNVRIAAQSAILILQASGAAIDQTYMLYVESLVVGLQTINLIRASKFGAQTFLLGAQVILMIRQIMLIKQKRQEAAAQTGAAVMLVRMHTYRY